MTPTGSTRWVRIGEISGAGHATARLRRRNGSRELSFMHVLWVNSGTWLRDIEEESFTHRPVDRQATRRLNSPGSFWRLRGNRLFLALFDHRSGPESPEFGLTRK
jgi:hypothetical protein